MNLWHNLKNYMAVHRLSSLMPHTNPMYVDQHSLFKTIGTENPPQYPEIYISYAESWQKGNCKNSHKIYCDNDCPPQLVQLVIYHAPTGERIKVYIDPSWRQDPNTDREKAVERVKGHGLYTSMIL